MNMHLQIFRIKSLPAAQRAAAWIHDFWPLMQQREADMIVEIYPATHKRTKKQNHRYWNVVLAQIEEKAWLDNERHHRTWWHEKYFTLLFNPIENDDGDIVGGSTSDLEILPFNRYMHSVEQHAIEVLGVEFDGDWMPLDFSATGNAP